MVSAIKSFALSKYRTLRFSEIVNKYSICDARKLDAFLPRNSECLDLTISSPPYWNAINYNVGKQIGFGQSYTRYLDDIERVFRSVHEATKPSGSLWIVSDTIKRNGEVRLLPFDIAQRLKNSGWVLQDIIIWQKDRTLPWSHQGKLRNIFEYICFYSKTSKFQYHLNEARGIMDLKEYWVRYPERYSPQGKTLSRSWSIPIPRQGSWGNAENFLRHACPLPIELVQRIIRLTTRPGDVVFDPFAGSGAVLATAKALNRRFIGVDLSRRYRKVFYSTVLPMVSTQLQSASLLDESQKEVRARFTSTIRELRCLKYGKEFVRLYRADGQRLGCSAVFVLPSRSRRKLFLLFCFPAPTAIPRDFVVRATELTRAPPLSKYGISADVKAVSSGKALRRMLAARSISAKQRFFVYRKGRFYHWASSDKGQTIAANTSPLLRDVTKDDFPPIVSSIAIRVLPGSPDQLTNR